MRADVPLFRGEKEGIKIEPCLLITAFKELKDLATITEGSYSGADLRCVSSFNYVLS